MINIKDDKEVEEFFKSIGYKKCKNQPDKNNKKCTIDFTAGASTNPCANVNMDMPGGFQDINPMVLTIISELIGNALQGKLPINVLTSYGNFLILIGQAMAVYNAQQQYQQGGPGRSYSPLYKNVANPFRTDPSQSDGFDQSLENEDTDDSGSDEDLDEEIKALKKKLNDIRKQINKLEKKK